VLDGKEKGENGRAKRRHASLDIEIPRAFGAESGMLVGSNTEVYGAFTVFLIQWQIFSLFI
jgi:hypothetical protein